MKKRLSEIAIGAILLCGFVLGAPGCSMKNAETQSENLSEDLMEGVSASPAAPVEIDDGFISGAADFSVGLFRNSAAGSENSLISPLSVLLALAMTANGADGGTLSQMKAVLGRGIPIDGLNKYLYSYVGALPNGQKSKLTIANSIWLRENDLAVEKGFLQANADYYDAAAYESAFDSQTLESINKWVKENTDGMIDSILDSISEEAVMYLINAVVFDAEWETVYTQSDMRPGGFTSADGMEQQTEFMFSGENLYLDDGKATGFIKPYANGSYSFAALLPNEDTDISDYMGSLTGDGFINTMKTAADVEVIAGLPKFSYDYQVSMNDALKAMGMPDAFSDTDADFSKLGASPGGNLFISDVLHKAFISVDELGTKAGASTAVEIAATGAMVYEPKTVILDRPFVYAVIDNNTNLPVFMGVMASCE